MQPPNGEHSHRNPRPGKVLPQKINDMKTTTAIRIPNPPKELVAFIKEAQQQKKVRMKKICDKYRKLINA